MNAGRRWVIFGVGRLSLVLGGLATAALGAVPPSGTNHPSTALAEADATPSQSSALGLPPVASGPVRSLKEVQEAARNNHPRLQVAQLKAQASEEAIIQARAAYLPHINQETVGAISNSPKQVPARLAAGWGLAPPPVAGRAAAGMTLRQLVTDFGRTASLVESSELKAQARQENIQATEAQVVLNVTGAYFQLYQAQEVLKVADADLAARETDLRQIRAMLDAGLKSTLDVSFAEVNVSEARLLQIKARNDLDSARAILSTAMGNRDTEIIVAREEPLPPPVEPLETALGEALYLRPDLRELRLELAAAGKLAEAEAAAARPKIELIGNVNYMPWINLEAGKYPDFNAIGGLLVNIPVFEGFALEAGADKARKEYQAVSHGLSDAENAVLRDVRVSWLGARTAHESLAPARQQYEESRNAYRLAESRYRVGMGSIVELTQAQLNLTRAAIADIQARVAYQQQRAELDYQTGKLR